MSNYWKATHTSALQKYLSLSDNDARNAVFERELAPVFYEMARRAQTYLSTPVTDEVTQDIVIHLLYKTVPHTAEKPGSALAYLWMSANNYLKTYVLKPSKHDRLICIELLMALEDENTILPAHTLCLEPPDLDAPMELQAVQQRILTEIDFRLKAQTKKSTTNSVFLLLLRDYVITNDFDVRGFAAYAMTEMHLSLTTFRAICGRLDFRTRGFREKLEGAQLQKK